MSRMRRLGGSASSRTRRRALARASRTFARCSWSRAASRRQAVASEATAPKSTSWSRSASRSQRASPPSAGMTPRSRRACPGSCRPRRMRRSERTPLSAAVSPTRSVKEPQSAWIFIEAGGGVFFAFRVTSLCLGLLASSTCSIPAQEVTVLSSRALFSWYSVAKVILAFVWCMPYDVGMPKRGGSVHVATIRTKGAGDRVYTSYLLRRSYREGGRVRHENLGNLSHLPEAAIEAVRRVLAGEVLVAAEDRFQVTRSLPHGHVAAVLGVVRSLDLERLISREPSREMSRSRSRERTT